MLYRLRAVLRLFGLRPEDFSCLLYFFLWLLQSCMAIGSTELGTAFQRIMEIGGPFWDLNLKKDIGLTLSCSHINRDYFDVCLYNITLHLWLLWFHTGHHVICPCVLGTN